MTMDMVKCPWIDEKCPKEDFMNIGKENEQIEFKKSTSELRAALDSISAILNKHGNGIIYFGVKDNGDVCGQQLGSDTIRDMRY